MRRYQKVLIWVGAFLLILGIGGYFGLNYAIDRMLNTLAGDIDVEAIMGTDDPEQQENEGESNSGEGKGDHSTKPGSETVAKPGNSSGENSPGKDSAPTVPPSSNDSGGEQRDNTESKAPPEGQQEESSSSEAQDNEQMKYEASISAEKASQAQEQITLKDKARVTSVLLKRLSSSDIQQLSSLASGGVSVEEKRQAKEIILDRLNEDEYNELIAIAAKLGLSQGKSYSNSQKE